MTGNRKPGKIHLLATSTIINMIYSFHLCINITYKQVPLDLAHDFEGRLIIS